MNSREIRSCIGLRIEPGNEQVTSAMVNYEDNPDEWEWISARRVPQNLLEQHMLHVCNYVDAVGENQEDKMSEKEKDTRGDTVGYDGESGDELDDGTSTVFGSDFIASSHTPSIHPSLCLYELEDEEEDYAALCCCKRPTQCDCECHAGVSKFKAGKKALKRVIIEDDDE